MPRIEIEDISPNRANEWLQTKNVRNRKVKPTVVARYAQDMTQGNWFLSDQAISFDIHGHMINGQHRCEAVIKSGVTIKSLVIFDMPEESMGIIDNVASRGLADRVSILDGRHVDPTETATARVMMKTANAQLISAHAVAKFLKTHADAINFTLGQFPYKSRGITRATVFGAIARAYYHEDHEKLARFCKVLFFGLAQGEDDLAAIKLRDICLNLPTAKRKNIETELYAKAEKAIYLYCRETAPIGGLYASKYELYELPEEKSEAEEL